MMYNRLLPLELFQAVDHKIPNSNSGKYLSKVLVLRIMKRRQENDHGKFRVTCQCLDCQLLSIALLSWWQCPVSPHAVNPSESTELVVQCSSTPSMEADEHGDAKLLLLSKGTVLTEEILSHGQCALAFTVPSPDTSPVKCDSLYRLLGFKETES